MDMKRSSQRKTADSAAKKTKGGVGKRTRSAASRASSGRPAALVVKTENGWAAKRSTRSRRSSVYPTREEAVAAARKLAGGGRVIVHDESSRLPDEVLASLIDTGDLSGGSRTTLRVPEVLEREVDSLSDALGLTKNEALVRLALAGSQLVERAREVAAKRETRRKAVFAAGIAGTTDELPSLEEMREAARVLRDADE